MLTTIKHSARSLRRSPVFAMAAILTLGLGLGANAVVYAFANAVFFRPLPFARENELVIVGTALSDSAGNRSGIADGTGEIDFVEFGARNTTLSGVGTILPQSMEVIHGDQPEAIDGGAVSASMWSVLGTQPIAGRVYGDNEDYRDAPIVVIGETFQRRFFPGSPEAAIGKTLLVNGALRTVIGVMPGRFSPALVPSDFWIPLGLNAATITSRTGTRLHTMVGRLKPGVTLAQANADLERIAADLAKEFPISHRGWSAGAAPLRQIVAGSTRTLSLTLMGFVVLLLALACLNVANLAFVRINQRLPELSTHLALGAGQRSLMLRQLCEGGLLGLGGGLVGILIVLVVLKPLLSLAPQANPLLGPLSLDWRVVVFVAIASVVTGTAVTFVPALVGIRTAGIRTLASAGRKHYVSARQRRLRQWLISGQAMAASLLLISSLVMTRAMYRLTHLDTGLRPDGVFVAKLTLPATRYRDILARDVLIERALAALGSTPGIAATGATNGLFKLGGSWQTIVTTDARDPDQEGDLIHFRRAWPGYFETVGLRPLRGRVFTRFDRDSAPPVAVVNQSFVRKYYPDVDVIGRRIKRTGNAQLPWLTVVGVVPDVMDAGVGVKLGPMLYISMMQSNTQAVSLLIRSTLSQQAVERALRDAIRSCDSQLPIDDFSPMPALMSASLGQQRLKMLIIGTLALLALTLASLGIYGVTAFVMAERRREIAIRVAMGAQPARMLGRLIGSICVWIFGGEIAGVMAAAVIAVTWPDNIPDIGGAGPIICAAAVTLLALVGGVAAAIPAYRATSVPPALALRLE